MTRTQRITVAVGAGELGYKLLVRKHIRRSLGLPEDGRRRFIVQARNNRTCVPFYTLRTSSRFRAYRRMVLLKRKGYPVHVESYKIG